MEMVSLSDSALIEAVVREGYFSKEEILRGIEKEKMRCVRTLTLQSVGMLEELRFFPGLEELVLDGKGLGCCFGSTVVLPALPALNRLSVQNIEGLEYLAIAEVSGLRFLQIVGNRSLHTIEGLEELRSLQEVVLYGNALRDLLPVAEMIGNKGLQSVCLDLAMLPFLVQCGCIENAEGPEFHWIEDCCVSDVIVLRHAQGMELLRMMQEVLYECGGTARVSLYEKVKALYGWVVKKIQFYDHVLVDTKVNHGGSAYYCLLNQGGDCDGFINLLAFGLSILNVQWEKVLAFFPEEKKNEWKENECHQVLLRVHSVYGWFYLDPVMESVYPGGNRFFWENKEGVLQRYQLSSSEKLIAIGEEASVAQLNVLNERLFVSMYDVKKLKNVIKQQEKVAEKRKNSVPYLLRERGQEKFLLRKMPCQIGRGNDVDHKVVGNTNISKHHCKVVKEEDGYYIMDTRSLNGTFVEQESARETKIKLYDGCSIRLADEYFVFHE